MLHKGGTWNLIVSCDDRHLNVSCKLVKKAADFSARTKELAQCFYNYAVVMDAIRRLADMCTSESSTTGRQHLCSAANHDLTIPRNRLARYASRSFATSGPSIWNSLPLTVRDLSLKWRLHMTIGLQTDRHV